MRRIGFALLVAATAASLTLSQTDKPVILCIIDCPAGYGPMPGIFQACAYATPIDNVCDTYTPQQCKQLTPVGLGQGMNMATCLAYDCYSPFGGGQPYPGYNYPAGEPVCADFMASVKVDGMSQLSNLPRPAMTTFLGFGEAAMGPDELSEGGRRRKRRFRWEGRDKDDKPRHVHLEYDVTHADVPVINLDEVDLGVLAVHCRPGGWMAIHMETPSAAARLLSRGLEGHFVTGGLAWRCSDERVPIAASRPSAILRRVELVRSGVHSPSTLHLHTSLAGYHQVFEHASVKLSVDAWPAQHVRSVVHGRQGSRTAEGSMRDLAAGGGEGRVMGLWGWVCNACRTVWHGIQTVAPDVAEAVEAAAKLIAPLVTGSFDWDKNITLAALDWNYDNRTGGAKERDLEVGAHAGCSNCYAHLGAGLAFDLHVSSYVVQDVASYLFGDLEVAIHASLSAGTANRTGVEGSSDLGRVDLPSVTFFIGPVPFVIQTSIPVTAGYTFTAMSDAPSVSMDATVSGGFRFGFQYTRKDGYHWVHDHSFNPKGSLPHASEWDLQLAGQVFLLPTVVMTIDHIGSPNVGFKSFVELTAMLHLCGVSPCPGQDRRTEFTVNWGLQLTLGNRLLVQFDPMAQPVEDLQGLLSPTDAATVVDMGLRRGSQQARRVKESFATVPGDGFPGTVVASVLPSQQSSGAVTGAYTVLDVTFPPYQFDSVKWPISSGFLLAQQPFSSDSSAGSQREAFVRELGGEGGPIFGGVSFAARVPEQDKPGCPDAAGLWVVMQFQEEQGGPAGVEYPYWVGSINHHKQVPNPVLVGQNYTLDYIAQVGYYAVHGVFNQYYDDFVKFRAEAPAFPLYSLDGPFAISADNTTLTLFSPNPCVGTLVMERHDILQRRHRTVWGKDDAGIVASE